MISDKSKIIIDNETKRLISKYDSIRDNCFKLEDICFNEYDVSIIYRTHIACPPHVNFSREDDIRLCYSGLGNSVKALWFGHEIGHIVAYKNSLSNSEEEADYFSIKLNEINLLEYKFKTTLDEIISALIVWPLDCIPKLSKANFLIKHSKKIQRGNL